MVYNRRNRAAMSPLVTDKHEVTWSNLVQNASTTQVINLAIGTVVADKNSATEVAIGSKITSIYFEFHFSSEGGTSPRVIHWQIYRQKSGETIPAPNTYYQTNRSSIFKRGMEMLPDVESTVFKRVFVQRIPKIYQRQIQTGAIGLSYICSSTETVNACGFAIYEEKA